MRWAIFLLKILQKKGLLDTNTRNDEERGAGHSCEVSCYGGGRHRIESFLGH